MKLSIILIIFIIALNSSNAQDKTKNEFCETVKYEDFSWIKIFENGSDVSCVIIDIKGDSIIIFNFDKWNYDRKIDITFNKNGETIDTRVYENEVLDKNIRGKSSVSSYLQSERSVIEYPNTYHQINTCQIPLKDSTKIKKLDLKYILECPRGCDLKSSIIAYFDDKTLELKFTRNMTIGSMHIHDIVQYDATSFVISFWYYKRGGGEWISDVRVGLLDLKQYLD